MPSSTERPRAATARAPASVGNVAVGFDILGFSVDNLADVVTVSCSDIPGVRITGIDGHGGGIPLEVARNTAGRALRALHEAARPPFGFDLHLRKGIPPGSGLGGSAASAVAAAVAGNHLLEAPYSESRLVGFALDGEGASKGARHIDNVAAAMLGGLVLSLGVEEPRFTRIPVPPAIRAVLVRPDLEIATGSARTLLRPEVPLSTMVAQTAHLAGFIAGCYTNDLDLIRATLADVVIEPQRQHLIPGFVEVQAAARSAGALGCSIAGSGPTMFALCEVDRAAAVHDAMRVTFGRHHSSVEGWIADLRPEGARIVPNGR